jgi:TRAP-type mannitol/chloroaromatic compound transport system permease large subunit
MMAGLFIVYIWLRCRINPALGPVLAAEELARSAGEKLRCSARGLLPLGIFLVMMVPFIMGYTRLVESSVIGALAAFAPRWSRAA